MILIAAFLLLLTSCSSTATLPEEGLFSKNSQGCQNIPTITYQPLTTYYVSTSGDDANDGLSADKPWKNLSYAEKTATEAGSMIALKKGDVFEMNHALGIHHGGVTNTPIVWDGATWGSGDQAVIKSTSNREAPEKSMVNIIGASHVIFQNITLDGNHTNTFGIVVGGTDSYYSSKGYQSNETNIVVQNNKILNCGDETHDYVIAALVQTWNTPMREIVFLNNLIDGTTNHALVAYLGRAVHGATPATLTNVYFGFNDVTNFGKNGDTRASGLGFGQNTQNGIMECNKVTQGLKGKSAGIVIGGEGKEIPKNTLIRYNDVRMTNEPGLVIQNGFAPTGKVYGNVFHQEDSRGKAAIWIQVPPTNSGYTYQKQTAQFDFFNNTIVVEKGNAYTDDSKTPGMNTFFNNLVINHGPEPLLDGCYATTLKSSTEHRYNACYRTQPGEVRYAFDGNDRYIYRSKAKDWEPTLIDADPKLKNLAAFDWTLDESSPLKQKGQIADFNYDRSGVAIQNPPTIGAYQ